MNRLILLPMAIIIMCACLSQAMKVSSLIIPSSNSFTTTSINGTQIINNSTSSFSANGNNIPSFNIIGVDGLLAILIGFVAIGAIAGITILGSGLSTSAQNVLYKSSFYYCLWGIFSALGFSGISSIPFGTILYIIITLIYVVGVQSQINTHESE